MMEYKGYVGRVEYDAESDNLHGEVVGTRDVITFEGRSVDELRRAFRESVDTYLDFCKEQGKSPDKPFSGKFVARIDPELHREIAFLAAQAEMSLNAFVADVFRQAVGSSASLQAFQACDKREHETTTPRAATRKVRKQGVEAGKEEGTRSARRSKPGMGHKEHTRRG